MFTVVSGGSFFKGLDNKIIFNSSDDRFFYNLKSTKVFIQDLDLPNKKITHRPASHSRRCLGNDERTVLLPVFEAKLRDSSSISIDQ